jgi:hypothetical protein
MGTSRRTSTCTVESAIFQHTKENGRTYHVFRGGSKLKFYHSPLHLSNSSQNISYPMMRLVLSRLGIKITWLTREQQEKNRLGAANQSSN